MKSQIPNDNVNDTQRRSIRGSGSKKMKKNKMRLGGKGLSLEVFANAKSKTDHYNPAIIKKQREFYKNAKCVSKYKKSIKNGSLPNDPLATVTPVEEGKEAEELNRESRKNKKQSARSLKVLYEKKQEEDEKARMERETIARAKKEAKEKSEAQRKAQREKLFKKTRSGQPIMKYRIEQLLESLQNSNT